MDEGYAEHCCLHDILSEMFALDISGANDL
jgi:hypothetical protein